MTSVRLRILIIENSVAFTGAFKSVLQASTRLQDRFEILYCLPAHSDLGERLTARGFSYFQLPFVEVSKSWKTLLYVPMLLINSWRLFRRVHRSEVSVIHVNDLFNLTGVLVKWLRPKTKLIYHIRLMPNSYLAGLYLWIIRLVSANADEVIFVSEAVRNACPILVPNSRVIYDGIDATEKYPVKTVETGPCRILYLANFTPGKGQHLALESFAKALPSLPGATLTFVGGDMGRRANVAYRKSLEVRIAELTLQNSVYLRGFEEDVEGLIKSFDVLMNCSASESFSMTCLEAMMYGTPVIATDSGGPGELLTPETGLLVRSTDSMEIGEALVALCRNAAHRAALANKARDEARRRFSLDQSVGELERLYRKST
jgi:glycosyltransferase involved in cell wall biosynthesis